LNLVTIAHCLAKRDGTGNPFAKSDSEKLQRKRRFRLSADDRLCGFGAENHFDTFSIATREEEKMYIGGGVVGTVVIVLLILFLLGRL
jgi:hypothetical protein